MSSVLRKFPMVGPTFQVDSIPDIVDEQQNGNNNEQSNLLFVHDSDVPVSFDNILKLKSILVTPGLIMLVPVDILTPVPANSVTDKSRTLALVESIDENKMATLVNLDGTSASINVDILANYISTELVIAKIADLLDSKQSVSVTMKEYEKNFQTDVKTDLLKSQWNSLMMECFLFLLFRSDNNLPEIYNHLLSNYNSETRGESETTTWCKDDIIRYYFTFRTEDTSPEYGIGNVKSLQRKYNFQIDSPLKLKVVSLFQKADNIIRIICSAATTL